MINIMYLGRKYNNTHMIDAVGMAHSYSTILLFSFISPFNAVLDSRGSIIFGLKLYRNYGFLMHRVVFLEY